MRKTVRPARGSIAGGGEAYPPKEPGQLPDARWRRETIRAIKPPVPLARHTEPFLAAWVHVLIVTLLLVAALGVCATTPAGGRMVIRAENDFVQLFTGASLVFTPSLYSPEVVRQTAVRGTGLHIISQYYSRLPFYAVLIKPLAELRYQDAYLVFQCINLACFVFFIRYYLLPRHPRYLPWLPLFFPLLFSVANGQDVTIVLFFCALFLLHAGRRWDLPAGACLSLCLIKFHLFAFLPLAILAHRRWRVLYGAAAGGAFWLTLSFAAAGWDWPLRYIALLRRPELHPNPATMPTIAGVLRSFDMPVAVIAMALICGAGFFVWGILRMPHLEASVAVALVAGIVLATHAYPQDCTLLLIAVPVLTGRSEWSLAPGIALMTPLPYFAALGGKPWNMVLPALMIALCVTAVRDLAPRRRPRPAARSGRGMEGDLVRTVAGEGA